MVRHKKLLSRWTPRLLLFGISVVFLRCSPIAPSVDKRSLLAKGGPSAPSVAVPAPAIQDHPQNAKVQVILFNTQLLEREAYDGELNRIKNEAKRVKREVKKFPVAEEPREETSSGPSSLITLSSDQMEELKRSRKITLSVQLPSEVSTVSQATAYVALDLPQHEIANRGLSRFTLELTPGSSSQTWTLVVPEDSEQSESPIADTVLNSTQGISLRFK